MLTRVPSKDGGSSFSRISRTLWPRFVRGNRVFGKGNHSLFSVFDAKGKEQERKEKYGGYDSSTHPNDSFFLPIFFILLQKFRTKTISDSKMYSSLYSWPFRITERKIDKNCNFTCKWKEQRIDFISLYVNQTRPLCYAFGTVQ